jgi:hypothetical protein
MLGMPIPNKIFQTSLILKSKAGEHLSVVSYCALFKR